MKKRIIALMIALAFMLSSMQTVSFAAEAGEHIRLNVTSSATKLKAGDEFDVVIRVSGNNNLIGALSIAVNYDKDVIEHVAKPDNTYETALFTGNVLSVFNADVAGEFTAGITALDGVTLDGDIVKFRFKVKDTVSKFGNYEFTVTEKDYDIFANNETYTYTLKDENIACSTLTIVNPCTGIKLDRDTLTIARGETATLTATVEPAGTTDNVIWSSEDKTIATVDSNGKVSGVKVGETTITATCGNQTASCKVIVNKAFLTGEVIITGNAVYGVMLTAAYIKGNAQKVEYVWYREGEEKPVSAENTYTITEDDIGKVLTVWVSDTENFMGSVKATTAKVEKATKDAPAAFKIKYEDNKIKVINPDKNAQYKLNNGAFGTATEFDAEYNTEYTVSAYYPETNTHKASAIVTSNTVITPKAPCNLTVTAGEGGTVDGIPEGTVREGDKVKLTANPGDFDHKFVKWEVTGITLTEEAAKANPITFTMGSKDVTITAVFKEKPAVPVGFGEDKTFTYNKKEQAPAYGPTEQGDMKVEVKYFVRGGNTPIEKPTNVGKYTMQVTYTPNSADSECRTTVATCDFEIIKANQDAPAVPTVKDIKSDGFTVENFVTEQQYAIKTTNVTPEEAE